MFTGFEQLEIALESEGNTGLPTEICEEDHAVVGGVRVSEWLLEAIRGKGWALSSDSRGR